MENLLNSLEKMPKINEKKTEKLREQTDLKACHTTEYLELLETKFFESARGQIDFKSAYSRNVKNLNAIIWHNTIVHKLLSTYIHFINTDKNIHK